MYVYLCVYIHIKNKYMGQQDGWRLLVFLFSIRKSPEIPIDYKVVPQFVSKVGL